ncbi:MAG: nuclear transport factor 2 family protein [Proteobacteria bacterium]|nr:nuclear transport factor 2 family protein [Pseudomonadota bacterium]
MPEDITVIARLLALLLAGLPAAASNSADLGGAPSPRESASVSQVWQREADYWRYVAAGDVEHYVSLWHDRFIGWPCGQDHPKRKASIGDWVREVRDKHIQVDVHYLREGAEDFGNVVIVHYRFTRVDTYPDGSVKGRDRESKITHTWMRSGDSWLIIGGMCGVLPDSAT